MSGLVAYHADDEILRVVLISGAAIAITIACIGASLMRRLAWAPDAGSNRVARAGSAVVAVGIAAYLVLRLNVFDEAEGTWLAIGVTLFLLVWGSGLLGLVLGSIGLSRVRTDGERRLAVLTFVGSLVLPGIFVANAIACFATDACFH